MALSKTKVSDILFVQEVYELLNNAIFRQIVVKAFLAQMVFYHKASVILSKSEK